MAVEIDIELDAAGVEGEIGRIAASLAGLERVADGLEIDFDGDIQDLADNLDELADSLEDIDIDFGLDGLQKQLDEVKKEMNDFELDHEVNFNAPEGGGGGGDSGDSGGRRRGGLRADINDLAQMINNAMVDALGGAFGRLDEGDKPPTGGYAGGDGPSGIPYKQIYGNDAVMMAKRSDREGKNDFSAGALHKLSGNDNLHNLGASDPRFRSGEVGRIGTRRGDGVNSISMKWRRMASPLSRSSIMAGGDPDDIPFLRQDHPGVPALAERKERDVGGSTLVDIIEELEDNAREAMKDFDTSFDFDKFNEDARDNADLRDMELFHQARSRGDFIEGKFEYEPPDPMENLGDLEKQQKKLYEAAGLDPEAAANGEYELAEGGPNSDKRKEELTDRERMEIEKQTGFQDSKAGRKRRRGLFNIPGTEAMKEAADSFTGFGKVLGKFKPTMGKYMQMFAALIPMLAAAAANFLGVAAAMGAVGAAGAGIIGLGLMGNADNLAEGMGNAKSELQDFKEEMFDTLQPAMQTFSPIQERMMNAIPGGMGGIVEEIQGLAQFEDTLMALGGMAAGGIERFFAIINDNADAISQVTTRFAGLVGSSLLDFFEFLIQIGYENQNMLIQLGGIFADLAGIAFNVAMVISRVITSLSPLVDTVKFFTDLLGNRAVLAAVTFTAATMVLVTAMQKLGVVALMALNRIGLIGSSSFLQSVYSGLRGVWTAVTGLIAQYTALEGAALKAAAAMALTGIGAIAVAGGALAAGSMLDSSSPPGKGGSPGRMGTGTGSSAGPGPVVNDYSTTVINQPDNDYASQKMVTDKIDTNDETAGATELPETDVTAESSDTEARQL
jgi:hypothetical protein